MPGSWEANANAAVIYRDHGLDSRATTGVNCSTRGTHLGTSAWPSVYCAADRSARVWTRVHHILQRP